MTLNKKLLNNLKVQTSFLESYLENPGNFISKPYCSNNAKVQFLTDYVIGNDFYNDIEDYDDYLIIRDLSSLKEFQYKYLSQLDNDFHEDNISMEDSLARINDFKHYAQIYYLDVIGTMLVTNHVKLSKEDSGFALLKDKKYFNEFCIRNYDKFDLSKIKDAELKEYIQNVMILS